MTRIVVIGNGMVGYKFCEKLVTSGRKRFQVTVFGEEPWPAYDRVHLSAYFSGSTAGDLVMAPKEWYRDNQIELRTNELIIKIDRRSEERRVGKECRSRVGRY